MSRNLMAAIAAVIVVAAGIILGFRNIGTPARERQIRQDVRTAAALQTLASKITATWHANKTMPANLEHIVSVEATKDPTTHAPFVYHVKSGTQYELCAVFLADNRSDRQSEAPFWQHGKGDYCFELDASQEPPAAPIFYIY
jgi:hypothetical protein